MSEYFHKLNYTLANEDCALEHAVIGEQLGHVVAIAGSGARVIPLLAKAPAALSCVDISASQLRLTELRVEALRALQPRDYLAFFDYPPFQLGPTDRKSLFQRINLRPDSALYWSQVFDSIGWKTVLYEGRWEKTFVQLSRFNRLITGTRGGRIFESRTLASQRAYLTDHFPHQAWGLVVRCLGDASVFNALLYNGRFPKKNIPGKVHRFYRAAFERLFDSGLARENFFLQIVFLGRLLYPEGNPFDAKLEILQRAKEALLRTQVNYIQDDILHAVTMSPLSVDFLSLSDVPSYFSGSLECDYLQVLRRRLSPSAIVVQRHYLHLPMGTDKTGFEDISNQYSKEIHAEQVQVYRIEILRNCQSEAG